MKTFDVITIGSVAQDTYLKSKSFRIVKNKQSISGASLQLPWGSKMILDGFHMEVGGGATNAAATFQRFGLPVSVIGRCGDDPSGVYVKNELKRIGIDATNIQVIRGGRTAYSVIFLGKSGERTILVYRGVTEDYDPLVPIVKRANAKWFYISSLGGDVHALHAIMQRKKDGVNIAWNPGKAELSMPGKHLVQLLRCVDVMFLNTEETTLLYKRIGKQRVNVPVFVITDGERGSVAYIGKKIMRTKIKKVKPIDTTGAGDAFGSGFVTGLLKKPGDFAYALYLGSANAMGEVQKIGTKHGILSPRDAERFRSRIRVTS